jgi:tetratricopeptide (TPR) repeat protein
MTDQRKASQLAKEGFDLWQSNRPEEAVSRYKEALALADQDHYGLPDYHGEFAGVLATLGRFAEARAQYELAIVCEMRLLPDSPGISVNRHFLADLLLTMNDAASALEVLAPGLKAENKQEWVLRVSEAEAHWHLADAARARQSAMRALETAPSDAKRKEIRERLAQFCQTKLESQTVGPSARAGRDVLKSAGGWRRCSAARRMDTRGHVSRKQNVVVARLTSKRPRSG